MGPGTTMKAIISRLLPQPYVDDRDNEKPVRAVRYGELVMQPYGRPRQNLAEEGSFFTVSNPTPGTPAVHAVVAAYDETKGLFSIFNNDQPGGKRVVLDYIKLMMGGTAPTATTVLNLLVKVGTKDKTPSANLLAQEPVNQGEPGRKSVAKVYSYAAGSLTLIADAQANARQESRIQIPTGLGITGDEYEFQFGHEDRGSQGGPLTAVRATHPCRLVGHGEPVIINPQEWCSIYRWWLTEATTAPGFEYVVAFHER